MRHAASWVVAAGLLMAATAFETETRAWQRQREASLRAADGWLSLVGLHWLQPGINRFEDLNAPVEFRYADGKVSARYQGSWRDLPDDTPGPPARLTHGSITLFVIERDGRHAVRVRDSQGRYRREFRGLTFYPPRPEYRVAARWEPYAEPRRVALSTVIDGITETFTAPGVAHFELRGRKLSLEPVVDGERLFFIFRDATSGKTTYPAGRFLYADSPVQGTLTLDFNRAYNPPCAFTPYATCPLPGPRNRLDAAIEAGELAYHY